MRSPRFRLRTLMNGVAMAGVAMGWVIHAWRLLDGYVADFAIPILLVELTGMLMLTAPFLMIGIATRQDIAYAARLKRDDLLVPDPLQTVDHSPPSPDQP